MSSELSPGQNFALGTVAALIEGLILQPTVYWKTARAQRLPFTLDPRLLYRGTGASIFNECQMMGIQFVLTGHFHKHILDAVRAAEVGPLKVFHGHEEILSAAAGGIFAAFFASPVELVMIQQQIYGGSFYAVPKRIIRDYGFFQRGVYRAVSMAAMRDMIYVCGMLGVTPLAHNYLQRKHKMDTTTAGLYSSLLGGLFAALPSHPFDVIKTCMQGDLARKEYTTPLQTLQQLWAQGKVRRLFAGGLWRSINIVSTVFIANQCMVYFHDYAASLPL